MAIFSFLTFLVCIICMVIGIYVYLQKSESMVNRLYLLMCGVLSFWAFSYSFVFSASEKSIAWFFHMISGIGWSSFTGVTVIFIIYFVHAEKIYNRYWFNVGLFLPGIIFLYKTVAGKFIISDLKKTGFGWISILDTSTFWFFLFIAYLMGGFVFMLFLLTNNYINSSNLEDKKSSKLIIISAVIVICFSSLSSLIFPAANLYVVPSLVPTVLMFWVLIVGFSLIKYDSVSMTTTMLADEVINKIKQIFILVDDENTVLKVNGKLYKYLGYEEVEVCGKNIKDIIGDKVRYDKIISNLENEVNNEVEFELDLLSKDDEKIPFYVTIETIKNRKGIIKNRIIVMENIEKVKKLENKLDKAKVLLDEFNENLKKYKIIAERAEDVIAIIGDDLCYEYINPAGEKYIKISENDGNKNELFEFTDNTNQEERYRANIREVFTTGIIRKFEIFISNLYFDIQAVPMVGIGGSIEKVILIAREITNIKENEQRLNNAKDIIEKDLKLKNYIVELIVKSSMIPSSYIQELASSMIDNSVDDRQRKTAFLLKNSVEIVNCMLNDLIWFTPEILFSGINGSLGMNLDKIIIGKTELKDKIITISKMLERIASAKNVKFTYVIANDFPNKFLCDWYRIVQVLLYVTENSIKNTKENGEVRLFVTKQSEDDEFYEIRFVISDSETSSQREKYINNLRINLPITNEMFLRNEIEDAGLLLCRKIVEALGGKIWAENDIIRGTKIYISLKLKKRANEELINVEETEIKNRIYQERRKMGKYNILVVEDNIVNQEIMKYILEEREQNFDLASNGKEAFELTEKFAYDMIFMDIQLPIMNGLDATKKIIGKFGSERPIIIAMTANSLSGDREKYLAAGMDDYISKPIDIDEIDRVIDKYLTTKNSDIEQRIKKNNIMDFEIVKTLQEINKTRPDFISRMYDMFFNEAERIINDMRDNIYIYDNEKIIKTIHKLKGSAVSVGAKKFTEVCTVVEDNLINGIYYDIENQMTNLEEIYFLTRNEVKEFINLI